MAIMLQALPTSAQYEPREVSAGNLLRPAFGGSIQPLDRKGDHWAWDVTIPAVDARACGMALFANLVRGKREPLVMAVPEHLPAQQYGAPVCDGVASGSIVPLRGLPPGSTVPVKWMSLILSGQRYLYLVASPAVVDGSGRALVPITSLLRRPTIDGAVAELAKPMIEGFVPPNQAASMGARLPGMGLQFTIEERD